MPVLVHLTDNDDLVKPGMEFDMEFITVDLTDTDYIPISAVMKDTENDSYYVFVVNDDDTLEKRTVKVGVSSDMYMQLISGIEKGEKIIESPDSDMKEGTKLFDYASMPSQNSSSDQASDQSSILDSLTGGSGGNAPQGGGGMGGGPGGGGGRPSGGMGGGPN